MLAGFLTVYLVWGSTYLAIRIALETLPPFLMAGARFLAAGGLLYAWARSRGAPRPEPAHWRAALVLGALFLLLGNGGVVWAEQRVPSGLAALMVGLTPVWTALFEWRAGGERPSAAVAVGLAAGVAGVALLVAPGRLAAGAPVDPLGAAACLISSVSWSFGSVRSRGLRLPASPAVAAGLQMLSGGALLAAAGLLDGEAARLHPAAVSARSLLAVGYLVVFGSLVAFTTFTWLLRVSTPSRVATCAYVNPVVAVFLGRVLGGEPLAPRTLLAAAVIVGAVAVITTSRGRRGPPERAGPVTEPETEVG